MKQEPAYIISFQGERFQRVHAVLIKPSPTGLTIIGGGNSQGKTSALKIVSATLGGKKFQPSDPNNRDFEDPAWTRVDMSNGLIIERKGKNFSLKVTDTHGLKGNQGVLGTFLSEFALDLPKFMDSSAKEKAKTLLKLIGVGGKLEKLEKKEKEIFDLRAGVSKYLKRVEAEIASMSKHEDAPVEKIVVLELLKELKAAEKANLHKKDLNAEILETVQAISDTEDEIADMQAKIDEAKITLFGLKKEHDQFIEDLSFHITPDIQPIMDKIENAENINAMVAENEVLKKAEEHAVQLLLEKASKDGMLNGIRTDIQALLSSANMPLPGLSIADGELIYNGAKWDCMGGAEQLKVATSIVKQLNPACGFVLLDKLEQMDAAVLTEFDSWARSEGLQIIATRVSEGPECSVLITDGKDRDDRAQEHDELAMEEV